MMTRHRQRGMTFIGWLLLFGLLGTLVMVGLRLLPAYMEYGKVRSSIEAVAASSNAQTSNADIRRTLGARFQVNQIDTVSPADVTISREGGVLTLSIEYEYRTPMIANIDAVVMFAKTVEGGAR